MAPEHGFHHRAVVEFEVVLLKDTHSLTGTLGDVAMSR